MKANLTSALAILAYGSMATAMSATEISDVQAIAISAGAGLFGGIVTTLLMKQSMAWRGVLGTILGSIGVTVYLVWATMIHPHEDQPDFALTVYPITGASVGIGMVAWAVFAKMGAAVRDMSPSEVRDWIVSILTRAPK